MPTGKHKNRLHDYPVALWVPFMPCGRLLCPPDAPGLLGPGDCRRGAERRDGAGFAGERDARAGRGAVPRVVDGVRRLGDRVIVAAATIAVR